MLILFRYNNVVRIFSWNVVVMIFVLLHINQIKKILKWKLVLLTTPIGLIYIKCLYRAIVLETWWNSILPACKVYFFYRTDMWRHIYIKYIYTIHICFWFPLRILEMRHCDRRSSLMPFCKDRVGICTSMWMHPIVEWIFSNFRYFFVV